MSTQIQPQSELKDNNYLGINVEELIWLYERGYLSEAGKELLINSIINDSQETKSEISTKTLSDSSPDISIKKKEQEERQGDTESTMTTSTPIKDLIDKDYDKELNNKILMALSGMNPYG